MSAQLLDKNNYISISEIIWPYRPDILIRIDFLDWFNKNKNKYFKKLINLSKENIINNNKFIEDAKEHPYFLQYTRKHRYRKINLSKKDSEKIYSNGLATFINLFENIKNNGFDKNKKIGLYNSLLLQKPSYGKKIYRKYYMGDGCHRLSCIIWLNKCDKVPLDFFTIQNKFLFRPVNSFGIFNKLGIFNSNDEADFYDLFKDNEGADFIKIITWSNKIHRRFKTLNSDDLFKIKFNN